MNNIFGIIMGLCFVGCYVPQIIKLYLTKSSQSVSMGMYWVVIVGYVSQLLYVDENIWIVISSTICLVLAVWTMYLIKRYE